MKKYIPFISSFLISLIIIGFLVLAVYTDYICRKAVTAITTLPVSLLNTGEEFFLKIFSFNIEKEINISVFVNFLKEIFA